MIPSVSRVTTALANVSWVFQLFSFLVICNDMISKGFGLVAFFASGKASSICIHLSCLVCIQSVVHGYIVYDYTTSGHTDLYGIYALHIQHICRSQWPRGLRRMSVAACLLRSWVQIPPGAWLFVCRECCVLSGRGLCNELITRPEESYRLWCVVCDLETSRMRRP